MQPAKPNSPPSDPGSPLDISQFKKTFVAPDGSRHGSGQIVAFLHDVCMSFDSYQVRTLTDVSFAVQRGEVFGLLGPTGSGKSTTLRILAGRLRPTEGKVRVFDRSPRRASTKARIGYWAEQSNPRREPGYARWLRFLGKLLARVEGDQDPLHRRARLSHAILGKRDLVVLDEPFSNLAPTESAQVKELIRTLAHSGKTVIFSGDSLAETKDICDRMAILYGGRIQATGTLEQLLTTTDALRFTAPLLPPTTAQQALNLIRQELGREIPLPHTAAANPHKDSSAPTQKASGEEPPAGVTVADAVLAPLAKRVGSEPPVNRRAAPADPVNHAKLAELTKPATDPSASHLPKRPAAI